MDVGAHLRKAREAQGISLALLAARTRVQPRILTAIESNDIQSIPPKPFGRGFVRSYAHEVGLDPERMVHDYFGQFAPVFPPDDAPQATRERQPIELPQWTVPAALALLVALGVMMFFRIPGGATNASDARTVVGTTGIAAPRPAAAPPAGPPAVTPNRIALVLRADRESWVTASADGERVLYQILAAGSEHTLEATREIVLRAGDAGALRLTLNGRDVGAFGGSGEVRQVRITPANVEKFAGARRR